ncbi:MULTISPECIES: DUF5693 family protein [Paenibacillus]|uniref:DUF5693 family protein n=1 Tax=Paenibacillus TaxID=44249 RepID=UPI0022B8BB74|nr:DUF5693 family protein [Paenibacillus caseinilyticus]MCZ8523330.1 DUF5693 family protein [Paenibacillus caseinilyticus]
MKGRYLRLNQWAVKALWWLVILGMLASLAIAYERYQTEDGSGRRVEFVMDYRDLLEISDLQTDPRRFVSDQLQKLKEHRVGSLAVYESSLNELQLSRRLQVYSSQEASVLTQSPGALGENFTYVLFADSESERRLAPLIRQAFGDLGVGVRAWSYKSQPGLLLEMSKDEAVLKSMDPDPMTLETLKEQGFTIVFRMSNRRAFEAARMDALLGRMKDLGVRRIIVDGDSVPGFVSEKDVSGLDGMSELLLKYKIGLAAIEMQKTPQRGFNGMAERIHHDVVRLHSFTENDAQKLTENITAEELKSRIQGVADRFVLAAKDRNIRMILLNARAVKSLEKGKILHPLDSLYEALTGADGAIPRIAKAGYKMAPAEPFQLVHSSWQSAAKLLVWAGSVALIALMVSYFIPEIAALVFLLGMVGSAGLYVLSASLFAQGLALSAGTSAASLSIMYALRQAGRKHARPSGSKLLFAITLLLRSSLISVMGLLFIVGLLNQIQYSLVLEQFRGVSLLHLAPIGIVGLYWLLFMQENISYKDRMLRAKAMLASNISVLWIIAAAVLAAAGYYYLSRTGNEGQASDWEKYFRSFLENTLGVRPRTKEFLLAHPLFLLGAYLSYKYRSALLLILAGVIGQASIVDTFAHLHTPLQISSIRVLLGLGFGTLIGVGLILVWEIITRSWQRWVPRSNE